MSKEGKILDGAYSGTIRSPLTCISKGGICQKCFGLEPGTDLFPVIGKSIGSISAYALAEPVTQMMLKTKHMRHLEISSKELLPVISNTDGSLFVEDHTHLVSLDDARRIFTGFDPLAVTVQGTFFS